jgi:hypothetical protein
MVHVIVTCANRMRRPIPEHLHLGQVPGGTQAERARGWIERLAEADGAPLVPPSNCTRVSTGRSRAGFRS